MPIGVTSLDVANDNSIILLKKCNSNYVYLHVKFHQFADVLLKTCD